MSNRLVIPRLVTRLLFAAMFVAAGSGLQAQDDAQKVFVHYMPWYASAPVSGQWGWHWTMDHFDPERQDAAGQPQAATHDLPLIGLYDSSDPHVLECQVQLMKLAGIDGVIVDWYGTDDFRDYAMIHRNVQRLVQVLKRADLEFAVCYEDQALKHMVEGKFLAREAVSERAASTINWLDENWFQDDAYLKHKGRPVLLVFGPQFLDRNQWNTTLAQLRPRPHLLGLPHLVDEAGADGAFGWPPVFGGRNIERSEWLRYLNDLYGSANDQLVAGVAFPGFRDIYQQAGVGESYGFIDAREGKTLAETLELAQHSEAPFVQIATWNDYGEGTMVEPTVSKGYSYLELLQQRLLRAKTDEKAFAPKDLRLPVALYQARKRHAGNAEQLERLQQVSQFLFKGRCADAEKLLKSRFSLEE